jgi:hypothetical protein
VSATEPAFEVKLTEVPSGTGFWKWSASRAVITVVLPSKFQPVIFKAVAAIVKSVLEGIPVDMESWLDWLLRVTPAVAPGVEAVTRTEVLIVPECTLATTEPSFAEMPVGEAKVMPPVFVFRLKVTVLPLIGLPPESNTLNVTSEVVTPPVPCKPILLGKAEINCMEPVAGGKTVRLAEEVASPPPTEATTVSVPAQP